MRITRVSSAWCTVYKKVVPLRIIGVSSCLGELVRITGSERGIRCDSITGKDIVMNGNTYLYSGNL